MIGRELFLKLKIQLNKLDTGSNRALYPEVGLEWLNTAYLDLVKAKHSPDRMSGTSMLKGQRSEDELAHLIKRYELSGTTDENKVLVVNTDENVSDYLYYQDSEGIRCNGVDAVEVKDKPIGFRSVSVNDPFNKPTDAYPIITSIEGAIEYTFGSALSEVSGNLVYLARPETITLEGEVVCPFCEEIVNTAAVQILENWEDSRVQSKAQLDQTIQNF